MADPNLSLLVTTTLRDRESSIADNISESNALLTRLQDKGNIRRVSGGRTLVKPISYDANSTFKYVSGYERFDTTPSDPITAAEYDWKLAVITVSISREEELKNSGSPVLFDILESKIDNAVNGMANQINADSYSDGTGSGGKQLGGLQLLVADDPTTSTTIGGINQNTYSWWRNYSYDATTDGGAAASSSNIIGYMNTVYNNITRGRDKPDLIVSDSNYFGFYESALQSQQRFTSDSDMAKKGFVSYAYKGADVVLENSDSSISSNHMYFLNTNYLTMEVHEQGFMQVEEERISIDQLATVIPIIFAGNMTVTNRALQGVLKD